MNDVVESGAQNGYKGAKLHASTYSNTGTFGCDVLTLQGYVQREADGNIALVHQMVSCSDRFSVLRMP